MKELKYEYSESRRQGSKWIIIHFIVMIICAFINFLVIGSKNYFIKKFPSSEYGSVLAILKSHNMYYKSLVISGIIVCIIMISLSILTIVKMFKLSDFMSKPVVLMFIIGSLFLTSGVSVLMIHTEDVIPAISMSQSDIDDVENNSLDTITVKFGEISGTNGMIGPQSEKDMEVAQSIRYLYDDKWETALLPLDFDIDINKEDEYKIEMTKNTHIIVSIEKV